MYTSETRELTQSQTEFNQLTAEQQTGVLSKPMQIVTWKGYEVVAKKLEDKIRESGIKFDSILAIGRGGLIIGSMLSERLFIRMAVILSSSYREEGGTKQGELLISKIAMLTDLGKCILLVDDLTDSGKTLSEVSKRIKEEAGVEDVKTAVLWWKTGSKFKPDFFGEAAQSGVWISQPYARPSETT